MVWQTKRLGDVCVIKPPKSEARKTLGVSDLVSFVPMEDLGIFTKQFSTLHERKLKDVAGSYTYFANGDVLMAKITPCFENGKIGIASNLKNGTGFGSSEYFVFRSKGEIYSDYLYYFLSTDDFRENGRMVMSGAVGHKRVPKEFIENCEIPLPAIVEQKRIVKKLDEIFENVAKAKDNAEKNLKNSKELFESYLQNVFTNPSKDWAVKNLGDISDFQNGFAFKSKLFKPNGSPILRISNIQNGGISYKRLAFFDKKTYIENLDKYIIQKGDLIIAMSGATTGKLAICDADEIFYLNQRVGKFSPGDSLIKEYLYYFLSTKIEENLSISAGAAQPNLSTEQIKGMRIPLPKIQEQKEIVKNFNTLSLQSKKLGKIYEQKLADLEELKKSILAKAFRAEL